MWMLTLSLLNIIKQVRSWSKYSYNSIHMYSIHMLKPVYQQKNWLRYLSLCGLANAISYRFLPQLDHTDHSPPFFRMKAVVCSTPGYFVTLSQFSAPSHEEYENKDSGHQGSEQKNKMLCILRPLLEPFRLVVGNDLMRLSTHLFAR